MSFARQKIEKRACQIKDARPFVDGELRVWDSI
jgi:hypothetical protein